MFPNAVKDVLAQHHIVLICGINDLVFHRPIYAQGDVVETILILGFPCWLGCFLFAYVFLV